METRTITAAEFVAGIDPATPKTKKVRKTVKTEKDVPSTSLDSLEEDGDMVVLNDYYYLPKGLHAILKRNISGNVPTLLTGPTGVGKTELIACLAKSMGLDITIFDMGTMTDPIMSLVGTHIIKAEDGKTISKFVPSRFSQVIQKPGIVLLDELPRASAQANNLLFPVLDFRKELSMEYSFEDSTPIKVHPQCVFMATANVGSQYTGSHKLDRALIDRFMLVEMDPLDKETSKKVISVVYPKLSSDVLDKILNVYYEINEAHDSYRIPFSLSMRHLKIVCGMVNDIFTIYDSFYAVCKGIGSKDGLTAISDIIQKCK